MKLLVKIKRRAKKLFYSIKNIIKSRLITLLIPSGFYFSKEGFCPCCDRKVTFKSTNSWLRDNLLCSNCNSKPRNRAFIYVIEKYYPNWKELSIHESSPGLDSASLKLKKNAKNYIGSHYFPNEKFGTIVNTFQNQDLENQTFDDCVFDLVVSQDVMEHIYNPQKAFSEIERTLKKGGAYIFTVPILNKHKKTEVWATKGIDGNPVFINKPEWHGNPINSNGSPVTMHWGYDIVDFIQKNSGFICTIESDYNLDYGLSAELNEVVVCIKQ